MRLNDRTLAFVDMIFGGSDDCVALKRGRVVALIARHLALRVGVVLSGSST